MKNLLRIISGIFRKLHEKPSNITSVQQDGTNWTPSEKITFEETVAHMIRGYENTQRVIQFMDAKAGVIVAFSVGLFAFVAKIGVWAFEQTDPMAIIKMPSWFHCGVSLVGFGVIGIGFACLDRAFKTVCPNGLPKPEHFSTLFPARKTGDRMSLEYLRGVADGVSKGFIINEFERQLADVGGFLYLKIEALRLAIRLLWWQGFLSVVFGVLIGITAGSGMLVKSSGIENLPEKLDREEKTEKPITSSI